MITEIKEIAEELDVQMTDEETCTVAEILKLMSLAYRLGYEKRQKCLLREVKVNESDAVYST